MLLVSILAKPPFLEDCLVLGFATRMSIFLESRAAFIALPRIEAFFSQAFNNAVLAFERLIKIYIEMFDEIFVTLPILIRDISRKRG